MHFGLLGNGEKPFDFIIKLMKHCQDGGIVRFLDFVHVDSGKFLFQHEITKPHRAAAYHLLVSEAWRRVPTSQESVKPMKAIAKPNWVT